MYILEICFNIGIYLNPYMSWYKQAIIRPFIKYINVKNLHVTTQNYVLNL